MYQTLLPNGKVKYQEKIKDVLTGQWKKLSITLDKDTAANRRKAQAYFIQKADEMTSLTIGENVTLEDLINRYLKHQGNNVKQSTATRNENTLNKICKELGPKSLVDNLSPIYVREKFSDYPITKYNEYLKRFKAMLRWGYDNELINNRRLIDKLKPLADKTKKERIADKYLEPEELKQLLDYMKDSSEQWYDVTRFLVLSGLRVGELIALNDEDVADEYIIVNKTYDQVNNVLNDTPKTDTSNREVYIQKELKAVIDDIRRHNRIKAVLYGYRTKLFVSDLAGNHISYYAFNKYLRESAEHVLGRKITTHILRHTHTSLMAAQGVNIETISRRLGHSNSDITKEIYLHITDSMKERDNMQLKDKKIL